MNKLQTVVLSVAGLWLAGCESLPEVSMMNRPACKSIPGGGGNPPNMIIITANQGNFGVAPPNLCVKNGDVVTVRVAGGGLGAGSVRVLGKSSDSRWISGVKGAGNSFTFTVPDEDTAPPGIYYYNAVVDGFGIVDPMLEIDE